MSKNLIVIGAGEAARPILKKAKEMGIITHSFSTVEGALAKEFADYFYPVSVFDIEKIYEQCQKISPDGIIASSEITTKVAAELADKLGLPGNNIKDGFAAQNKYIMRQRVSKCKYADQPKYFLYEENANIEYPVVVKATDSAGKRGITLVTSSEHLKSAVEEAKKYSSDGNVLIEEYLEGGKEYSAECLAYNGKVQIVQITEKDSSGPPHFIELGHHQPAELDNANKELIGRAVDEVLTVLGIKNSIAHFEFKLINNKLFFIEVGARGGGGMISEELISLSTDFDYFKAAIEIALGEYCYKPAKNIAHTGIYFLTKQTESLLPLFLDAKNKTWCFRCILKNTSLLTVKENNEKYNSGYLIYKSDRKITLENYQDV